MEGLYEMGSNARMGDNARVIFGREFTSMQRTASVSECSFPRAF